MTSLSLGYSPRPAPGLQNAGKTTDDSAGWGIIAWGDHPSPFAQDSLSLYLLSVNSQKSSTLDSGLYGDPNYGGQ